MAHVALLGHPLGGKYADSLFPALTTPAVATVLEDDFRIGSPPLGVSAPDCQQVAPKSHGERLGS